MLTIAKLHGESVAYYESTVSTEAEHANGPDAYYSEDGTKPATAWILARSGAQVRAVSDALGVEVGAVVDGDRVRDWFNKAVAPSGEKLGRAPKQSGVPGFDLTFCAPKSVSILWGVADDPALKQVVDQAHARAVESALSYFSEHAGYTRRADARDKTRMVIDRVEALSGVKYEHRTSRSGDPHVHSHVLLSNKQLCRDGKWRTLDSKGVYHEARAAGMLYQAVIREELSRELGVSWGEVVNGCAEIAGLDSPEMIRAFSTRAREIDAWRSANGLDATGELARVAQKKTRQRKDLETPLAELEAGWKQSAAGTKARGFIASLRPGAARNVGVVLPDVREVLAAVVAERSTFTRADVVEKIAEMMPVGAVSPEQMREVVEQIADEVFADESTWTVTPEKAPEVNEQAREGAQRFTTDAVVAEIDRGIDVATSVVDAGVDASAIVPIDGKLSQAQAEAMRAVVQSRYLASVVVAPAGAGKTSSLKAARRVWEQAGRQVVGLAPTGKAADVMVGEQVAHSASTVARVLLQVDGVEASPAAQKLGWGTDTVVVVDEAGMVATPDVVRILEIAQAAGARVVFVGDPNQYGAVKARGGMLATLAHELPDAVELTEVFRQKDPHEREASKQLRTGQMPNVQRAADFYAAAGRLHAGAVTAMMDDALAGWKQDISAGKRSILVASNNEYVAALNAAAQAVMAERGELDTTVSVGISGEQVAHVGDTILTRNNDYELVTSAGDVVRNGQRWQVEQINADGSMQVRRLDETNVTVTLNPEYVGAHVQLGYATSGHASQGATVDVARVVAAVGQIDQAGAYVPLTRGREGNYLYMAEAMPGDSDTGHGRSADSPQLRRESTEYARDLLVQAATRSASDQSPYAIHRNARADWELAKLAATTPSETDVFAGTRINECARRRAHARLQRLEAFYASQRAPRDVPAEKPQEKRVATGLIDKLGMSTGRACTAPQQPRTPDDTQLIELRNRVAAIRAMCDEHREAIAQLDEQETRTIKQREQRMRHVRSMQRKRQDLIAKQDNRGWFARTLKPNEYAAEIAECDAIIAGNMKQADQLGEQAHTLREEASRHHGQLEQLSQEASRIEAAIKAHERTGQVGSSRDAVSLSERISLQQRMQQGRRSSYENGPQQPVKSSETDHYLE